MLSPKTNAKLAKALRQLAADQAAGNAPPPGEISREELARRAGISPGTVQNIEIMFAARLAAALCRARQDQTGKIRPYVSLDSTCENAQLSAKLVPDFMNRVRAGEWPQASILDTNPTPTP